MVVDQGQLLQRALRQLGDLGLDHVAAVEQVLVFQQVGLVGQHLLQAQRPLLVERTRQAQGLVPGRQLQGPAAGVLAQRDGQGLDEDAVDVVLGLLLGQAQAVDLHPVAEAPGLLVLHAVALQQDLVPQPGERPHLAQLGDEPHAGVDEEADARGDDLEVFLGHLAAGLHGVEHADRRGQGEGQFLLRRRARLLQVVAADVHRVPFGNLAIAPGDHVADQPQARAPAGRCRCRATGIP
jgi:hypothetical protein